MYELRVRGLKFRVLNSYRRITDVDLRTGWHLLAIWRIYAVTISTIHLMLYVLIYLDRFLIKHLLNCSLV